MDNNSALLDDTAMISNFTKNMKHNFKNKTFEDVIKEFSIPSEIKTDLLYCQKNLKNCFQIHNILSQKLESGSSMNETVRRSLDEIEYIISEINAEQKYLLLRLRRVMDEYFKMLKCVGIDVNHTAAIHHISAQIKDNFKHINRGILPCAVRRRPNFDEFVVKFDLHSVLSLPFQQKNCVEVETKPVSKKQVSLLKPKEERVVPVEVVVPSSQVNKSRLNLREALGRAFVQTSTNAEDEESSEKSPTTKIASKSNQKTDVSKKKEYSSSSEDSHERSREATPEYVDIKADTQESFLYLLSLCTKSAAVHMQQRRSKRKRRCVQNNDKPDFLYGHIDFDHSHDDNKKRKTLLMSPPAVGKTKKIFSSNEMSNMKCNECGLSTEYPLKNCCDCLGYFHDGCHSDESLSKKIRSSSCPSCIRIYAKPDNRNKSEGSCEKDLE